jgi:hypothetical protein
VWERFRELDEADLLPLLDPPERSAPPRDPSPLGLPAGLTDEQQLEALRDFLRHHLGDDAELVARTVLLDEPSTTLDEELGLARGSACRRIARAKARLRIELEGLVDP